MTNYDIPGDAAGAVAAYIAELTGNGELVPWGGGALVAEELADDPGNLSCQLAAAIAAYGRDAVQAAADQAVADDLMAGPPPGE